MADGWQAWDLRRGRAHAQPGMKHTHYWPPTAKARAQEWVDQHKAAAAASPGHEIGPRGPRFTPHGVGTKHAVWDTDHDRRSEQPITDCPIADERMRMTSRPDMGLTRGYCVDCGLSVMGSPVPPKDGREQAVEGHEGCPASRPEKGGPTAPLRPRPA